MRGLVRASGIAVALIVVLAPFAFLFLNGFKPSAEFALRPPRLLPSQLTFEHYAVVFDPSGETFRYLRNSLIVTGCATALAVSLGTAAASASVVLSMPPGLAASGAAGIVACLGSARGDPGLGTAGLDGAAGPRSEVESRARRLFMA